MQAQLLRVFLVNEWLTILDLRVCLMNLDKLLLFLNMSNFNILS